MRKLVGWIVCNILYGSGHVVSKCMNTGYTGWLYPTYNRLMCWSVDVNDWAGLSVWQKPKE
jgi:hypothetical protein